MARQVNVSVAQLATFALAVMSKASVPADDESIAMTQAARQFLHGVADGSLTVGQAQPPEAAPAPPAGAPARGSDGVVSGPVHHLKKRK